MCDTLIATKLATSDGVAVFGKNSDRHPNEGQHLAYFPSATHPANSRLQCTYIEIQQAQKTHAVLLSKPFWMWGAEMGVNEYGLVIGNEAVFSKIAANKKPALLGMDMLRAALERAITPEDGVQVIIDLLEQYGQGGNCTNDGELYYHNSFIVANADDAWVLETVDRQWAARQVKDVYSISNCLTIKDQWDKASPNLIGAAVQKGFTKSADKFNYERDYSDFLFTTFGKGRVRRDTTYCVLDEQKGAISVESMMGTLRHHKKEDFDPQTGLAQVDVCMHAGFGPIRVSQSTASIVVYLDRKKPVLFATGTSAPCTSVFKPIWMDATLPVLGPVPTASYDPESLYWTHERLHRAALLNYPERMKTFSLDRDRMEKRFLQGAFELSQASSGQRSAYTAQCFSESIAAEAEWLQRVVKVPARRTYLHGSAWNTFNKKAGMPAII